MKGHLLSENEIEKIDSFKLLEKTLLRLIKSNFINFVKPAISFGKIFPRAYTEKLK